MIGPAIFFQEDFFHAYHTGDSRICFGRCSCAGGTCGSISARLFSAAEKDSDTASDGVFCTGGLCTGHSLCNADGQNCAAIRAFPESGSLPDVYGAVADGKGEKNHADNCEYCDVCASGYASADGISFCAQVLENGSGNGSLFFYHRIYPVFHRKAGGYR